MSDSPAPPKPILTIRLLSALELDRHKNAETLAKQLNMTMEDTYTRASFLRELGLVEEILCPYEAKKYAMSPSGVDFLRRFRIVKRFLDNYLLADRRPPRPIAEPIETNIPDHLGKADSYSAAPDMVLTWSSFASDTFALRLDRYWSKHPPGARAHSILQSPEEVLNRNVVTTTSSLVLDRNPSNSRVHRRLAASLEKQFDLERIRKNFTSLRSCGPMGQSCLIAVQQSPIVDPKELKEIHPSTSLGSMCWKEALIAVGVRAAVIKDPLSDHDMIRETSGDKGRMEGVGYVLTDALATGVLANYPEFRLFDMSSFPEHFSLRLLTAPEFPIVPKAFAEDPRNTEIITKIEDASKWTKKKINDAREHDGLAIRLTLGLNVALPRNSFRNLHSPNMPF